MSMTDPVADFLTRLRNAAKAQHRDVAIPSSKLKRELARILKEQGYIESYQVNPPVPGRPGEQITVTLRDARAYEFLDRLTAIALPRLPDFRGLNPRSFDGRGNYSLGVREQIIFPEIDYDEIDQVRGLDITITTTAQTDAESFALLEALGMPFSKEGRPGWAGTVSRAVDEPAVNES